MLDRTEFRIDPNKRLILEIGTGGHPFPVLGRRIITAGEYYLGIERDPERFNYAQSSLEEVRRSHQGDLELKQADASKLDFLPDSSVSEIVMVNVFGEYGPGKRSPSAGLDKIVIESARLLREHGELLVVETYTPTDLEYLKRLLSENFEYDHSKFSFDPELIKDYAGEPTDFLDQWDNFYYEYAARFNRHVSGNI